MDRPLEITDFSGGFTDDFIDASSDMCEVLENVDLEKVGLQIKPKTRPGSAPVINTGANTDYISGSADTVVLNANLVRRRGLLKTSKGNKHKLYSTDLINPELKNNGVPFLFTQYAEEIYNAGIFRKPNANTYAVSDLDTTINPTKEIKICTTDGHNESIIGAQEHTDFVNDSRPIACKKLFVDSSNILTINNAGLPNPDIFLGNGADIAIIAGAAQFSGGVAIGGASKVLYCYLYARTYILENGATVLDRGAPSTPVECINTPAAGNPIQMRVATLINSDLDTLAVKTVNRAKFFGTQCPIAAVVIEVYKTKIDGSVFYKVGEYANNPVPTIQVADSVLNADLDVNELLYTEDGSQPNDCPPNAMYVHAVDNTCFYGNIAVASKTRTNVAGLITYTFNKIYYPNRVYHSIPGDLDSVPQTFFIELQDEVKGISSYRSIPIVYCRNQVFRLEGSVDVFGKGSYTPVEISKHAGCKEHNYIVQTTKGIFWAGNDGFYWTDGYKCEQISTHFKNSYESFWAKAYSTNPTAYTHHYGNATYNEATEKIYWPSLLVTSLNVPADQRTLVLHTQSSKPGFTKWSIPNTTPQLFGYDTQQWTSYISIAGVLLRATKAYFSWHDSRYTSDRLRYDNGVDKEFPIVPKIRTFATSFGDNFTRKFCTRSVFTFRTKTNTSLAVNSINDGGASTKPLKTLRLRVSATNPTAVYPTEQMVQAQRRFPAKHLRCAYKQLELVGASVVLTNSDVLGLAQVVKTGPIANLRSIIIDAPNVWPASCVGNTITLVKGAYKETFTISQRTSNTQIEVLDPLTTFPATSSGYSFYIEGYPLDENFTLLGISLHWEPLGRTQDSFNKAETGVPS